MVGRWFPCLPDMISKSVSASKSDAFCYLSIPSSSIMSRGALVMLFRRLNWPSFSEDRTDVLILERNLCHLISLGLRLCSFASRPTAHASAVFPVPGGPYMVTLRFFSLKECRTWFSGTLPSCHLKSLSESRVTSLNEYRSASDS